MQPIITVFACFTRRWACDRWLDNLANVQHDPALTNLALLVDTDEPYIINKFKQFAAARGYRKFVFAMNEQWSPNEVRLKIRRLRIADVKNQSKDLINQCDGDIVISFEDDTVFPGIDLKRLYGPLQENQEIGFVEGVQCGRWGVKMIGAWSVDDYEFPQRAETLMPGEGYQEIDAGGWYGYATRKHLYLHADYHSSTSQPWGPDVNYGLWLRNRGYICLIDWETVFGHNDHNVILYPDEQLAQVIYTKDGPTGRWKRDDIQQ